MTITFIQSVQTAVNQTQVAITPTAGNLLLVCFGADQGANQFTNVTDDSGGSYSAAVPFNNFSAGGIEGGIYFGYAPVSTVTTITVHYSAGQTLPCMIVAEYSGCDPVSPIDAPTQTANGTTGTALSTTNLVSSVANEMLVGFCCFENQNLSAFGAGFNHRSDLAVNIFQALEDQLITTAGTSTPVTFTASVNGDWQIMGLLLKPPGAPGPPRNRSPGGRVQTKGRIFIPR